jgi:phosphatidylserine/phosphatidylglycerophosphate/cardiolipin synthase-like enzyme
VAVPGTAPLEGPYFSDSDRVADRIIAAINHTKTSLDLAIFDLTHPAITAALEDAQRRGVQIRIVADQRQAAGTHSEIPFLTQRGISVRLSRGYKGDRSLMHNKFAVFDGRLAVTGSFNWTTSADSYNFENAVFISDPTAVGRFTEAFERLWSQAA